MRLAPAFDTVAHTLGAVLGERDCADGDAVRNVVGDINGGAKMNANWAAAAIDQRWWSHLDGVRVAVLVRRSDSGLEKLVDVCERGLEGAENEQGCVLHGVLFVFGIVVFNVIFFGSKFFATLWKRENPKIIFHHN